MSDFVPHTVIGLTEQDGLNHLTLQASDGSQKGIVVDPTKLKSFVAIEGPHHLEIGDQVEVRILNGQCQAKWQKEGTTCGQQVNTWDP